MESENIDLEYYNKEGEFLNEFYRLEDFLNCKETKQILEEEHYNNFEKNMEPKLIKFLKYFYNRARPHQIDPSIKPLTSTTAHTPSYPAGHAFQAYYLAKQLTKKYPHRKHEFDKIAQQCDDVRVIAGLHYPSDGEFAKKIVDKYF